MELKDKKSEMVQFLKLLKLAHIFFLAECVLVFVIALFSVGEGNNVLSLAFLKVILTSPLFWGAYFFTLGIVTIKSGIRLMAYLMKR